MLDSTTTRQFLECLHDDSLTARAETLEHLVDKKIRAKLAGLSEGLEISMGCGDDSHVNKWIEHCQLFCFHPAPHE